MKLLQRQAPGRTLGRRVLQILGFGLHAVPIVLYIFRARWEGLENVPPNGPAILAPNHTSVADASLVAVPIFLSHGGRLVRYVAARDQLDGRWSAYIRFFSTIPVNQDGVDLTAYRRIVGSLEAGRLVGIFPEQGMSRDGRMQRFHPIASWVALNAGVPLIPVTVNGMYETWPPNEKWPRRGHSEVIYHPPIPCQEMRHLRHDREAIENVNRRLREAVASRYAPPESDSR